MASDKGRNKGIKRKSRKSAEESANKQFCSTDDGSTSTGITHVDQAEGNVGKINWMKCCEVQDFQARPRCDICNKYYPFYIDPSTFKDHCKKKHRDIDTEGKESEWMIFRYFTPVKNTQHLKCRRCDKSLEVLKFKGRFVKHFDDPHDKIAEQKFQRGNEDQEVAERLRLTKQFIVYLHTAFANKDAIRGNENKKKYEKSEEDTHDVRIIARWMKHVGRVERNTVFCGVNGCQDVRPFPVFFLYPEFKAHVQSHDSNVKFGENVDNFQYFLFDDYLLRCKRCHKALNYKFKTDFTAHLNNEHNITAPWRGDQSGQGVNNNDDTNKHINELMLYLIENYKPRKVYKANKPTQAVKINVDMDTQDTDI